MLTYLIIALTLVNLRIFFWRKSDPLTTQEKEIIRICLDNAEEIILLTLEIHDPAGAADTLKTLDILKEKIK